MNHFSLSEVELLLKYISCTSFFFCFVRSHLVGLLFCAELEHSRVMLQRVKLMNPDIVGAVFMLQRRLLKFS